MRPWRRKDARIDHFLNTMADHRADVPDTMNIVILDDYQDAVRKLHCASRLDPYSAKVYTNTVKGLGQLSVRLKDADAPISIASWWISCPASS
jgi:hypothetical protein